MEDVTLSPMEVLERRIETLYRSGRHEELNEVVNTVHPADIAELLDELPPDVALHVFDTLTDENASEVLDETGSLVRQTLIEQVDAERLADLLDELPMDDAAEFLDELPNETAIQLLELMEPTEAKEVREILGYQDETAGRLMTRDVAALRRHWSVSEAMDYLRSLGDVDETETVHYLYVVDRYERLIGVVPIRHLLLARPESIIETIMIPEVITVPVTADQEELAEIVSKYDFVAIPVVDHDMRLLGVVTVDDVLDVLEEEATEDIQRLGGSQPLAQPYFAATVPRVVGKRLIWLLPLFAASLLTDLVVDNFSQLMAIFVSLTIFLPVVSGTGGNSGSQTVATIIRALAVGEVRTGDFARAWLREFSVAVVLGLILGVAGYFRALLLGADSRVAIVLSLTLPLVVMWANTVATIVPLVAERLRIDPAVVSAPMITTIVDASGLLIYLSIARAVLS